MSRSFVPRVRWVASVVVLTALFAGAQSTPVTLSESGSTLIYPLFRTWTEAYVKTDPSVHITAASTGSGAGISDAIGRRVQIGASDAYMSDDQAMANPHVLNIPLVISAQIVVVNLPDLRGRALKLSGPVLAGIYSGKIRMWDAQPIADMNRGVSLPHRTIVPVRRADGSGDTFIFTQYLTFSTQTDGGGSRSWGDTLGYGTSVNWPQVQGGMAEPGTEGVLHTIARTPYSLGYMGTSYEDDVAKDGLMVAMLQNQNGNFLLPNASTIKAAAAELTPRTPADERLSLVFAPGANSYPLINYEYALVTDRQPNQATAQELSNFLQWCLSPQGGSAPSFLDPVHFIPLPISIRARSEIQIAKIQ
ncbi:MAG: phosphate ABC transporter substrate-binding protein PstS [Acidobacteriaceae bacterium]